MKEFFRIIVMLVCIVIVYLCYMLVSKESNYDGRMCYDEITVVIDGEYKTYDYGYSYTVDDASCMADDDVKKLMSMKVVETVKEINMSYDADIDSETVSESLRKKLNIHGVILESFEIKEGMSYNVIPGVW